MASLWFEATPRVLVERDLLDADMKLARMLLSRSDREMAVAIASHSLLSWDFRDQMEAPA